MIEKKELINKLNSTGVSIEFDLPVEELLGEDIDLDDFTTLVQDAVQVYRKLVLDTIQNMPEKDAWIICKNRVPDEDANGYYMTSDNKGRVGINYWMGDHFNTRMKIVAWKPMPEAYSEVENNEN